ncbi:MAG: hypothetical protein V7647_2108 [Acidobacteriota bacterium]|jgi:hypothetical protein
MHRICVLVLVIVCASAVRATVLIPAEFREIVSGSEIIVYGRVVDVHAEWADDRRQIDTVVSLEAATYLKGGPGELVTFKVPGGQIGRYRNMMVGAPEFHTGEEAVVFLSARGPSVAHVFGLNQGVFRVHVDARTGARVVMPPVLMATGDDPELVTRGAVDRAPLPLETFAATVRTAMAQPRSAR